MRIGPVKTNTIVSRWPVLTAWCAAEAPDAVCLQAPEGVQDAFRVRSLDQVAAWRGRRAWNGVATPVRRMIAGVTRPALPGDRIKAAARFSAAAVNGAPGRGLDLRFGKRVAGPKFGDKLARFRRSTTHAQRLPATGVVAAAVDRRLRGLHGANDRTQAGMALDR